MPGATARGCKIISTWNTNTRLWRDRHKCVESMFVATLQMSGIPAVLSEGEFWAIFGRIGQEQVEFKRGVLDDL